MAQTPPQQPYPPPQQPYPPAGQPYSPPPPGAYPPQHQQPYAQPYPGQPGVVYAAAPVAVVQMGVAPPSAPLAQTIRFTEVPALCTCQFCGHVGPTQTTYQNGGFTWLIAGGICILGGCLGCCLIPFCINSCKDVEHHCGSCHQRVGLFSKLR